MHQHLPEERIYKFWNILQKLSFFFTQRKYFSYTTSTNIKSEQLVVPIKTFHFVFIKIVYYPVVVAWLAKGSVSHSVDYAPSEQMVDQIPLGAIDEIFPKISRNLLLHGCHGLLYVILDFIGTLPLIIETKLRQIYVSIAQIYSSAMNQQPLALQASWGYKLHLKVLPCYQRNKKKI